MCRRIGRVAVVYRARARSFMCAGLPQFAGSATAVDYRRDCVLEDKLVFAVMFEQHGELVETLDAPA